jgi:ArsR family transcriptional regulator
MRRAVRTFKALSDETRLRILHLLIEAGEMCVCDIETVLGCSQTRVSRHLAILRNAGLIEDRRQGQWMFYSLVKSSDPIHRSTLRAIRGLLNSTEEFISDKKRLQEALRHGKCRTFQEVRPPALPKFLE